MSGGTLPNSSASNSDLQPTEVGGYLTLTVIKNPAATDVQYSVEKSTDLDSWSTAGTVVITDDANSLVVRSATLLDAPGNSRQFLRAVFTLVE